MFEKVFTSYGSYAGEPLRHDRGGAAERHAVVRREASRRSRCGRSSRTCGLVGGAGCAKTPGHVARSDHLFTRKSEQSTMALDRAARQLQPLAPAAASVTAMASLLLAASLTPLAMRKQSLGDQHRRARAHGRLPS